MKYEFSRKAPLVRLAFAVAALSATVSTGGFIDFLATGYAIAGDGKPRPVLTAERKS